MSATDGELFSASLHVSPGKRRRGSGRPAVIGTAVLDCAAAVQHFALAGALFGLGAAVNLSTPGGPADRQMLLLGAASWVVVAGLSYAGVLLTT
ncbi:hypothetical protein ACIQB5_48140 [Streptomyces sp. NPDC088560]|uniref:hypothetical protein n=1 Tax=Streptomyces sp. NPDC088560 TaxID=3365868 RepID=UPI00382EEC43